MSDKKISQLTASTTPLAGTEVLPIVQSGATKKTSVESVLTSVQPSGTANAVAYLNSSKVLTSSSALKFDGTNFAIGVPPSAWEFGKALEVGNVGHGLWYAGTNNFLLVSNAIYSSGYKYAVTGTATHYQQYNGQHQWWSAPSGTAGDPIPFTQVGEFDTSGNFKVNVGNLVIGTAGKGIDFSADGQAAGMTSELLDDYEEGTWTPVVFGATTAGTTTYSTQVGTYTKIGRLVTCQLECTWSAQTGTGALLVGGLPFTSASGQPSSGFMIFNGFLDPNLGSGAVVRSANTIVDTYTFTAGGFGNIYSQFSYIV